MYPANANSDSPSLTVWVGVTPTGIVAPPNSDWIAKNGLGGCCREVDQLASSESLPSRYFTRQLSYKYLRSSRQKLQYCHKVRQCWFLKLEHVICWRATAAQFVLDKHWYMIDPGCRWVPKKIHIHWHACGINKGKSFAPRQIFCLSTGQAHIFYSCFSKPMISEKSQKPSTSRSQCAKPLKRGTACVICR